MSPAAARRMLVSIFYDPPSRRFASWLITTFSERPHRRRHPDLDPHSPEFIETLPELPRLVIPLFDWADARSCRVIARWADRQARTGQEPPARWRRA